MLSWAFLSTTLKSLRITFAASDGHETTPSCNMRRTWTIKRIGGVQRHENHQLQHATIDHTSLGVRASIHLMPAYVLCVVQKAYDADGIAIDAIVNRVVAMAEQPQAR